MNRSGERIKSSKSFQWFHFLDTSGGEDGEEMETVDDAYFFNDLFFRKTLSWVSNIGERYGVDDFFYYR